MTRTGERSGKREGEKHEEGGEGSIEQMSVAGETGRDYWADD